MPRERAQQPDWEQRRDSPMVWLYNALWMLALPGVVCHLALRRLVSGKYRHNLRERLGMSERLPRGSGAEGAIWVHALSVGEVVSVISLVRLLREEYPLYPLIFSTTTESGQRLARERLADTGCRLWYLPLDLWWVVRRVVEKANARLFVLVETDLWPNLIRYLKGRGTATALVNGRMSDRSFRRYRLFRTFLAPTLFRMDLLCLQGEEDARRLKSLGVKPDRMRVTGNLKFDQLIHVAPAEERELLLGGLGWVPRGPVLVAGSTHPGEEEILLSVFARLRKLFPDLCLILAPRHPARAPEVARLAERGGWRSRRRSLLPAGPPGADVFILDTLGELGRFYSLGSFAFVGGSLVPVGGHNPLEPAHRGVPVVFGPHMGNFRDIAALLREEGGGFQVADETELMERLERWLRDPKTCTEEGKRAQKAVLSHQGAARRTVEAIGELL